jgi:hypothetical protein
MTAGRWIVAAMLFSGCATLGPRTSGVDGPIEWKAVDLKLERKDQGSLWVYSFNLELRNTRDQPVTLAEMEYVIYQPGSGSYLGRRRGSWTVPPGGVLRMPLSSNLSCGRVEGNCTGTLMPIPLWRITFTGSTDSGAPVRSVVDLRLPADPQVAEPVTREPERPAASAPGMPAR